MLNTSLRKSNQRGAAGASASSARRLLPASQRFLRPSPELRKLTLLRALRDSPVQSQAKLGKACGVTSAIVNRYIEMLHSDGLVKVESINRRDMSYELTEKGNDVAGMLLDEYGAEIARVYDSMRSMLEDRMRELLNGESARVAVFGAAATSEILVMALTRLPFVQLTAIVDSDPQKIGKPFLTYMVSAPSVLSAVRPDLIIVASWAMKKQIIESIQELALPDTKVVTL